jgi:hypothetical protein
MLHLFFFFWAWYLLFHFPHWFIITCHDLYCFTSLIGTSLLGIVSFDSSLLSMICIYHFKLRWFIITEHCSYCVTTRFTGSSLLGMVCIVSLHASLVHSYWALFVFCHFPHLFIIPGHGLYCLTTPFMGSSLLGMVSIVSLHASLVLHYWA